jgi:hypothetical protein
VDITTAPFLSLRPAITERHLVALSERLREQIECRAGEERSSGGEEQWRRGVVEERSSGGEEQWRRGAVEERSSGGEEQWRRGAVEERSSGGEE